MATSLYRIIKHGFQNFWRHRLTSVTTLFIILLALMVVGGLILSNAVAEQASSTLQDKIDISVYFKTTAAEDDMNIQSQLENLSEVQSVQYISQAQALTIFESEHQGDRL